MSDETATDVRAPASAPPAKRPRRRWFQFSLRTLLVVTTLVAVWLGMTVRSAERQRRAVALVQNASGEVFYHSNLEPDDPFADPLEPPGPDWLRDLIGDDYFDDVAYIKVQHPLVPGATDPPLTDADLEVFAGCKRLVMLMLAGANITDDGLRHLSGLDELELLHLSRTAITDAGVAQIAELTSLNDLDLSRTKVTDEGLAHITKLVKLQRLQLFGTRVSDAGLLTLAKLPNLDTVDVMQTQVTAAGIARLQRAKPNLTICSSQLAPTNP